MADVVGVRFKRAGRIYYFNPSGFTLDIDDYVVVETSRGLELGLVAIASRKVLDSKIDDTLKPVVRKAEKADIDRAQEFEAKEKDALVECGRLINKLNLPMKLLSAEYNFNGNHLTFFFSAEERVDFRRLVRELTGLFRIRIELRQVGSRDEARLVGDFGRCGRQLCCLSFLSNFTPVSIKMAKEQSLPLNPMRISGICGRLLCCLCYECEQYHLMKEELPRAGQKVTTSNGPATVVDGNPLKETVTVELESGTQVELPLKEITVDDETTHKSKKD